MDDYKTIVSKDRKKIIVNVNDFDFLSKYNWWAYSGSALGNVNGQKVYMHRLIVNAPKNLVVDHINHDRLDNRRENLRLCTKNENKWNTQRHKNNQSGFKGVSWNKNSEKWESRIRVNGNKLHLGYSANPINCALAYNLAAKELFGEYALLN